MEGNEGRRRQSTVRRKAVVSRKRHSIFEGAVKYLETYILYVHKQYTSDEAVENPQRYALTV